MAGIQYYKCGCYGIMPKKRAKKEIYLRVESRDF